MMRALGSQLAILSASFMDNGLWGKDPMWDGLVGMLFHSSCACTAAVETPGLLITCQRPKHSRSGFL
jgi:hypothetical protein